MGAKAAGLIDLPQTPPAAYEQVLERKLVGCGLRRGAFTVSYEDELQSVQVVIGEEAGAGIDTLDCIQRAAGREIVSFDDRGLQAAYDARVFDAHRDAILGDARRELEERGLLKAFPERSAFGSDELFTEALERHCGMMPGAYKRALQRGDFLPGGKLGPETPSKTQISCLMAAISYAFARGDSFEFGFIGNEAIAPR